MSTKNPADITALVIKDAAIERRDAQARVDSIAKELDALQAEANKGFEPLAVAVLDAEAAVRAHSRYKKHLPRKEWDAEQRRLQKALDAAAAKRDDYAAKARDNAKPIQKRLEAAVKAGQELEQEWRVHERTAKVAGIDVDALLEED